MDAARHAEAPAGAQSDEREARDALLAAPLFRDLPSAVAAAVAAVSSVRRLRAGETLLTVGQHDGSEFYCVASGAMKVSRPAADGEMVIERILPGEFYGLAAAVCEKAREDEEAATIAADPDSTVVCVDAAAFRDVVAHRPSLTRALMLHFAAGLVAAARGGAADGAPERRIFAALLGHAEREPGTGVWRIARMPKHRELAERAGADEAAVAAAVARLIQDGVARRDYPGLVVADMARLTRLAS